MRFFTDHFFSESQKITLLGDAYQAHHRERLRDDQLERERQERLRATEYARQQEQDKRRGQLCWALVAGLLVCGAALASLMSGWSI